MSKTAYKYKRTMCEHNNPTHSIKQSMTVHIFFANFHLHKMHLHPNKKYFSNPQKYVDHMLDI